MISLGRQIKDFNDFLLKSRKIVIFPHKDPDGDAIGSCLGWYNVLLNKGKDVNVVSQSCLPAGFEWMNGFIDITVFEENQERTIELISKSDLILFLDFNSFSRIDKLRSKIENTDIHRIVIDHHPDPETGIGDIVISSTEVSSTCELSYNVMVEMGLDINFKAAECLYAGIMTDTGALSYNSSRPETYNVVASLISKGIDKEKIHKEVYHSNSLNRLMLLGFALCNKLKILEGLPVAYIYLSKSDLQKYDYKPGDTEGLVNYPLSIDGIDISALFLEKEENFIKASFRSRSNVAINKFSEIYFNGGGHHNAAGGEKFDSLENTINHYKNSIKQFLLEIE